MTLEKIILLMTNNNESVSKKGIQNTIDTLVSIISYFITSIFETVLASETQIIDLDEPSST